MLVTQTQAVTQAAPLTTDIIIPANSQLVFAKLFVSVIWNGAASTTGLGMLEMQLHLQQLAELLVVL